VLCQGWRCRSVSLRSLLHTISHWQAESLIRIRLLKNPYDLVGVKEIPRGSQVAWQMVYAVSIVMASSGAMAFPSRFRSNMNSSPRRSKSLCTQPTHGSRRNDSRLFLHVSSTSWSSRQSPFYSASSRRVQLSSFGRRKAFYGDLSTCL
jgi:hypothetical protein